MTRRIVPGCQPKANGTKDPFDGNLTDFFGTNSIKVSPTHANANLIRLERWLIRRFRPRKA